MSDINFGSQIVWSLELYSQIVAFEEFYCIVHWHDDL